MISEFIREQKRYTQNDLCNIMRCSEENVVPLIRKLKQFNVLKAVKSSDVQLNMSELQDEDIEVADVEVGEDDYLYVFTFVGVIIVSGRVLKCYPKYLLHDDHPIKHMCKVLKVLEKYNSKEQIVHMFNEDSEEKSFNLLAVLLFLLQDYFENGIYNNTEDIIECNGNGEIIWEKTINETFALISSNRPYYLELQTKKHVTDDYDYFKRLHECILTKASRELKDAELLDLFEITEVDLTDEALEDFGEDEYILYRIEKELNTQFNTRKQLVLKTLATYIAHKGSLYDTDSLSLFGTNSFNLVWEGVCSDIVGNCLKKPLNTIKLPIDLKWVDQGNMQLIELIDKPYWSASNKPAPKTLEPDIITISDRKFIIFDAKYYNAKLEEDEIPSGQPGVESIIKQYMYQLAYKRFMKDHGFESVVNCFLLPTDQNKKVNKGFVKMEMLANLKLEDIEVRLLDADIAFDCYLSGQTLNLSLLEL